MDKEDILKKARESKEDERENLIEQKAFKYSWIFVTFVIIIIGGLGRYYNQSSPELPVIIMAQFVGLTIYKYYQRKDLLRLIFGGLLAVGVFVIVFADLLSEYGVF